MTTAKQLKSPSELFRDLAAKWPEAFNPSDPKPLKIGIHRDIRSLNNELSEEDLRRALRAYTKIARYLANLHAGAARIDLDGNPVAVVSEADAAAAKALLRARNSRKASEQSPEIAAEPESSARQEPKKPLGFKEKQTVHREDGVVVVTKRRRPFRNPAA